MVTLLPEVNPEISLKLSDLHALEAVDIPNAKLARREIDPDHIYQLVLSDPDEWPPIMVTATDQGYVVSDGYHRWEAAKRKGMKEIRAEVKPFDNEHALIEATFRANMKHGLKSSVENRSNYARWLNLTFPELTQQQIAERCQLRQATVSKALARAKNGEQKPEEGAPAPEQRRKEVIRTCKHLTQDATHLLDSIKPLPEAEQRAAITEAFSIRDRELLRQILRLLEEAAPASSVATPSGSA